MFIAAFTNRPDDQLSSDDQDSNNESNSKRSLRHFIDSVAEVRSICSEISSTVAANIDSIDAMSTPNRSHELVFEQLSAEEKDILRRIVNGETAKQIGVALDISVRTFHYRKKTILDKLAIHTRSELLALKLPEPGSQTDTIA
jgi:DNA-binding NarL/FixJ family response regulator